MTDDQKQAIDELEAALARTEVVRDPASLAKSCHDKYVKDAHVIQSWCNADGLSKLLTASRQRGMIDATQAAGLSEKLIADIAQQHVNRDWTGDYLASIESVIRAALAAQAVPDYERMRHIANEWADMAANGMQWLRNIEQGISTVEDAIANMQTNYAHCRKVNDATGRYGQDASPAPAEAKKERTSLFGRVTITGPAEDVAFVVRHLPDVDDPQPQAAQPVGYVDPQEIAENFSSCMSPAAHIRKDALGRFTQPLYTAAPALTEEHIDAAVTEFDEWAAGGNQQTRECIAAVVRAALRSTQGGE